MCSSSPLCGSDLAFPVEWGISWDKIQAQQRTITLVQFILHVEDATKDPIILTQILCCPASIPDTLCVPGTNSPFHHIESFLYSLLPLKDQVILYPGQFGAGTRAIWGIPMAINLLCFSVLLILNNTRTCQGSEWGILLSPKHKIQFFQAWCYQFILWHNLTFFRREFL